MGEVVRALIKSPPPPRSLSTGLSRNGFRRLFTQFVGQAIAPLVGVDWDVIIR